MLDSLLVVETPEGVSLSLRLAGVVPRSLAFAIDMAIRVAIYLALGRFLGSFQKAGLGVLLVCMFLLEWFYPVIAEVYFGGATPGKRVIGLTVVEVTGLPVGWQASMVRNLLRTADFLPFAYGFALFSMLASRHFQRLGDLAAGTVVVWRQSPGGFEDLPQAPVVEPPVRLSLEEQRSIVTFAERSASLSPERQRELADLATPLTGQWGERGLQALIGMANYLVGRR